MTDASTSEDMSPGLRKVAERARKEPEGVFHSLAHIIDVPALERAYRRARKDAAVGIDGVTKEQYGQDLETRLGRQRAADEAVSSSADPTCPHPEGKGQDAAHWGVGIQGYLRITAPHHPSSLSPSTSMLSALVSASPPAVSKSVARAEIDADWG